MVVAIGRHGGVAQIGSNVMGSFVVKKMKSSELFVSKYWKEMKQTPPHLGPAGKATGNRKTTREKTAAPSAASAKQGSTVAQPPTTKPGAKQGTDTQPPPPGKPAAKQGTQPMNQKKGAPANKQKQHQGQAKQAKGHGGNKQPVKKSILKKK